MSRGSILATFLYVESPVTAFQKASAPLKKSFRTFKKMDVSSFYPFSSANPQDARGAHVTGVA